MKKRLTLGILALGTLGIALVPLAEDTWTHDNIFMFNSVATQYGASLAYDVDISTFGGTNSIPRAYVVGSTQHTSFNDIQNWTQTSYDVSGSSEWTIAYNLPDQQESPPIDTQVAVKTWIFADTANSKEYRVAIGYKTAELNPSITTDHQRDVFVYTARYTFGNSTPDSGTEQYTYIDYGNTKTYHDVPVDVTGRMVSGVPTYYVLTHVDGKAQTYRLTDNGSGAITNHGYAEVSSCIPTAIHCEPTSGSNPTVFVTGQMNGNLFLWQATASLGTTYTVDLGLDPESMGTTKPKFRSSQVYVAGWHQDTEQMGSTKDYIVAKFAIGDDVVESYSVNALSGSHDVPADIAVSTNGVFVTGTKEISSTSADWLSVRLALNFATNDAVTHSHTYSGLTNSGEDRAVGLFISGTDIFVGGKAETAADEHCFRVIKYSTVWGVNSSLNGVVEDDYDLIATGFRGRHVGDVRAMAVCGYRQGTGVQDMVLTRFDD